MLVIIVITIIISIYHPRMLRSHVLPISSLPSGPRSFLWSFPVRPACRSERFVWSTPRRARRPASAVAGTSAPGRSN
eukprot:3773646-Pyramimonas_sp.AAC.1